MKQKFNFIVLSIIILFLMSCDILRTSFFEVSSWTPGPGYHSEEISEITLTFSLDPERPSVERNISIAMSGESVRGNYHWKGNKLIFLPFVPLETNKDYSIYISSAAKSKNGLSMDNDFNGGFTSRLDNTRPLILSFGPETYSKTKKSEIICFIEFSIPMSLNSLRNNASFSPSMPGIWDLEREGKLAVFTPSEPWPHGRRFEMRLSSTLAGSNGMTMEKEFTNVFTIGAEREAPYLISAHRITNTGEKKELLCGEAFENSGWEKADSLLLEFSAVIDPLSANTAVSADSTSALKIKNDSEFSHNVIFAFDKPPVFESRFLIQIKSGIKDIYGNESTEEYFIKIFANGKYSKPPSLIGIRIPMVPNATAEDDLQLTAYQYGSLFSDLPITSSNYPYSVKTDTWIECYFDCAEDSSIDLFSLMELFRIETSNNVIQFTPVLIKNKDFLVLEPHSSWQHLQRIEIKGTLTNTVNSGLVHFIINQGLKDNAGNTSEKQFRISTIK